MAKGTADEFFEQEHTFQKELEQLRSIMLDCGLTEELKWGSPCYSHQKKNIVVMGELKDSCVIGFFKGVLLSDPEGILVKPGDNTQSARSIHFTNVKEIVKLATVIKSYVYEAIAVEEAGLKVPFKKPSEMEMPEEFEQKLKKMPALKKAFEALTPGRQKSYLLHFSSAKQPKTRESRIEKCIPQIMQGKGYNEY